MRIRRLIGVTGLLAIALFVVFPGSRTIAVEEVSFGHPSAALARWDAQDVVVVGNYAYCALWGALVVFDVSDPASPQMLSYTPLGAGGFLHIVVAGSMAYMGGYDHSLYLLDVSDPVHPFVTGQCALYQVPSIDTYAWDIDVVGDYVYVCGRGALEVVHVADPRAPVLTLVVPNTMGASGLDIQGDYAYMVSCEGLRVYDITNPASPVLVSERPETCTDYYCDVKVVGNFAYRTRANLPMFVYDVTNPADPQLVSTLSTGYPLFECESSSQLLYIAAGDHPGGVVVLDVTHPAAPTLRSLYNLPGSLGDIALAGPWIYVANGEGGLLVLDAADPDTLKPYGSFNMPWWGVVQDVAVSGSYAYVASSDSGVQIVDLTNPILPVRVAGFKVAGRTGLVEAGGDRLYSTHTPVGMFHMRDLADPVAPVWFGQGGPIGDARSLAVAGRYLYLANGDLRIFDLEAQANIAVLVGTFITPGTAMDVSVAGDLAFVADSGQGLVIVDVADRAAPAQAGELDLPGPVRGVAVSGNTVCVASGLEGLHVIDVSVPASPVLTGTYNTPGYAHAVELDGDYAIVAAGYDGVQVINVSNPTTPYMYIAGTLNTMGESLDLTLVNGRVYIADRVQLLMVDVSLYSGGYTLGDVDESGDIASSDIIALVNFVFKGGPQPMPVRRAGDLNCDGPVSSTDVILLVNYVFKSAPSPVCP